MKVALMALALTIVPCSAVLAADYAAMTGKEVYRRFCASCHGVGGRGDGPVADSFTIEVPDLTSIARRARGVYPRDQVVRIIDGRHILAAHGSRTMPVWGVELTGAALAEDDVRLIIERLADYVGELQQPSAADPAREELP